VVGLIHIEGMTDDFVGGRERAPWPDAERRFFPHHGVAHPWLVVPKLPSE